MLTQKRVKELDIESKLNNNYFDETPKLSPHC